MKKISFSLLFLFPSLIVNAQFDTSYINAVYAKILEWQPEGVIYYGNKPRKELLSDALKGLDGGFKELAEKGLRFTKIEKKFLKIKLPDLINCEVPDQLFPQSQRLDSDTICEYLYKQFREGYDSLRARSDTVDLMTKLKPLWQWAYFISEPVYLRGKTVRVSYFSLFFITGSGESRFDIEIWNDGKWEELGVHIGVAY